MKRKASRVSPTWRAPSGAPARRLIQTGYRPSRRRPTAPEEERDRLRRVAEDLFRKPNTGHPEGTKRSEWSAC